MDAFIPAFIVGGHGVAAAIALVTPIFGKKLIAPGYSNTSVDVFK